MPIDWKTLETDVEHQQQYAVGDMSGKSPYLKKKAGNWNLRIIPAGNDIDNVPYVKVSQHAYNILNKEGRKQTVFVLCYNAISERLNTLGKYLISQNKLKADDIRLFKAHGCPGCVTVGKLQTVGVIKDVWQPSIKKESFLINVMDRENSEIFAWNISLKVYNSIFGCVKAMYDAGQDVFDPQRGFDITVRADFEGFQRRYASVNWLPIPKPIGMFEGQTYHDLYELMSRSCKPYTEFANICALAFGSYLDASGITIPGSTTDNILGTPTVLSKSETIAIGTETSDEIKILGDGMIMKKGVLYNSAGKAMF